MRDLKRKMMQAIDHIHATINYPLHQGRFKCFFGLHRRGEVPEGVVQKLPAAGGFYFFPATIVSYFCWSA